MKKIALTRLKAGRKAKVIEISGALLQSRLMSMGIYPGREITKMSSFAMRGPVTIRLGRSSLALGHGMADKILVVPDD